MAWTVARIEAVGSTTEPGFWEEWAREPDFGGGWQSIGNHFRITGFGVNANVADAGRELIVPHSETEYGGQEELYLVIRGRARFSCDGEVVELAAGEMVHVGSEVLRDAIALEDGTLVLCVGGTPGQAFSPS